MGDFDKGIENDVNEFVKRSKYDRESAKGIIHIFAAKLGIFGAEKAEADFLDYVEEVLEENPGNFRLEIHPRLEDLKRVKKKIGAVFCCTGVKFSPTLRFYFCRNGNHTYEKIEKPTFIESKLTTIKDTVFETKPFAMRGGKALLSTIKPLGKAAFYLSVKYITITIRKLISIDWWANRRVIKRLVVYFRTVLLPQNQRNPIPDGAIPKVDDANRKWDERKTEKNRLFLLAILSDLENAAASTGDKYKLNSMDQIKVVWESFTSFLESLKRGLSKLFWDTSPPEKLFVRPVPSNPIVFPRHLVPPYPPPHHLVSLSIGDEENESDEDVEYNDLDKPLNSLLPPPDIHDDENEEEDVVRISGEDFLKKNRKIKIKKRKKKESSSCIWLQQRKKNYVVEISKKRKRDDDYPPLGSDYEPEWKRRKTTEERESKFSSVYK